MLKPLPAIFCLVFCFFSLFTEGDSRFITDPLSFIKQKSLVSPEKSTCIEKKKTKQNCICLHNMKARKLSNFVTVASADVGYLSRMQPDHPAVGQHDFQQRYQGKERFHFTFTSLFYSRHELGLKKCLLNKVAATPL